MPLEQTPTQREVYTHARYGPPKRPFTAYERQLLDIGRLRLGPYVRPRISRPLRPGSLGSRGRACCRQAGSDARPRAVASAWSRAAARGVHARTAARR